MYSCKSLSLVSIVLRILYLPVLVSVYFPCSIVEGDVGHVVKTDNCSEFLQICINLCRQHMSNFRATKMLPCGTPEVLANHSDSMPSKTTRCNLFSK